jgi:hypothetical protein
MWPISKAAVLGGLLRIKHRLGHPVTQLAKGSVGTVNIASQSHRRSAHIFYCEMRKLRKYLKRNDKQFIDT